MSDMIVCNGRPENLSGREEKEVRVYDFLDGLGISYLSVDHEAAYTMEACIEVEKLLGVDMCKNLFLCNRQETKFYLLLIPGDKKFKTKDISEQIGSARLSFAKENYMEAFLDITPGSVSVLGLMNDHENRVQLLIDRDILEYASVGCHPCVNTASVKIHMNDLVERVIPAMKHEPVYVTLPTYAE